MRQKVAIYVSLVLALTALTLLAAVIPFDPAMGLVEVQVKIDGRVTGRFGIDTGADHLYIDRAFAEKNNLPIFDEMTGHQITGVEGISKGYYAQLRSLEIGDERLYNLRATVADIGALGGGKAGHPDGLIGFEVIRRFYVTVDYPNTILQLYQGEPSFLNRPGYTTIPFEKSGHLIFIEVTFNDKVVVPMILDFCASYTSVSKELAARIGLDPKSDGVQKVGKMSLGESVTRQDVKLVAMDFTAYRQGSNRVNFEGIIGTSFLYPYKITIDYKRKRIYVHH
ncbi:MAG: retropepsin-like domain-containing protein [candidate division Zixibacteria bacterium]|nr:retropepsin-like domain-containing protein [candidate division Zixibacteria bacterium]